MGEKLGPFYPGSRPSTPPSLLRVVVEKKAKYTIFITSWNILSLYGISNGETIGGPFYPGSPPSPSASIPAHPSMAPYV